MSNPPPNSPYHSYAWAAAAAAATAAWRKHHLKTQKEESILVLHKFSILGNAFMSLRLTLPLENHTAVNASTVVTEM